MPNNESLESFIEKLPALAEGAKERLRGHQGAFRLETAEGRVCEIEIRAGLHRHRIGKRSSGRHSGQTEPGQSAASAEDQGARSDNQADGVDFPAGLKSGPQLLPAVHYAKGKTE